jgi:Fuc2NAc and GlcNAc transferase
MSSTLSDLVADEKTLLVLTAFVLSAVLTGCVRKLALERGVVDVPNERSSHQVPTPRGGGVAIVLTVTAGLALLALIGDLSLDLLVALAGGGAAVAVVGFIDDRRSLSVWVRLVVHFGAAIWALAWIGGVPPLQLGERIVDFGWLGYPLGAVGIVWVLNLFNFMDGIDGIAGSEAAFIAIAGACLLAGNAAPNGVETAALILAAACCGFLCWNWPPARIFMGDAGSGYLGYFVAVAALAAARDFPVALIVWLILGAVFFVDATVTFARRLSRGENVRVAHRSHAYQWLARKWQSHRRVTVAVLLVNVLWLLPMAFLATRFPPHAGWILVVALGPVLAGVMLGGAGRRQ